MKRIFTIIAAVLITATIWAQSPEKMSYQAVVRNTSDVLITNTTVGMQISILQSTATGTEVYVETQTPTTNANGLLSMEIGAGTVVNGDFTTIDWSAGPYFIKTETDLNGGSTYTIMGVSQLMSVPFALHAKTAENFTESDPIYTSSEAANIIANDITNLGNLSGVNTGDQDITGIATNATDISTIQGEQTTQDGAIALNTAKVGITAGQATIISNTSGVNTGDQDITGIVTNATDIATIQGEQTTQDGAIALNTAKVGITTGQATIISNTSGVNTGDQDITGIVTNATDIATIQGEQTTQDVAIALNTAKVGITTGQATILSNTSGVNTGDQDISNMVTTNTTQTITGAKTLTSLETGSIKITGGSPGSGKVLTSDGSGNGSWQAVSSSTPEYAYLSISNSSPIAPSTASLSAMWPSSTYVNGITVNASSFVLKANKMYEVTAHFYIYNASGAHTYKLVDVTNSTNLGTEIYFGQSGADVSYTISMTNFLIKPTADINVEFQHTQGTGANLNGKIVVKEIK